MRLLMCIMTVMYQVIPDVPVVLAANRDEYYSRHAQEPTLLSASPAIWGGRDQLAGGTWLGVNEYGLVVGLTNRRMREDQENDSDRRSRGLLCLDALKHGRATDVVDFLASEPRDHYNAFNLLVLDGQVGFWIVYDGKAETHRLQPGLHILANRNLNEMDHTRVRRAHHLLSATKPLITLDEMLPRLERSCADHEVQAEDREMICMHRDHKAYGTVSSTILAIATNRLESQYRYAHGHPCQIPYHDLSRMLTQDAPHWVPSL